FHRVRHRDGVRAARGAGPRAHPVPGGDAAAGGVRPGAAQASGRSVGTRPHPPVVPPALGPHRAGGTGGGRGRPDRRLRRRLPLPDPRTRSLVLEMTTRLVFPTLMVLSVYFFFAGHNHPGGGFAGGLTVGLALTLRYLAGGRYEIGETLPIDAGKILGAGFLLAAGTAGVSLLLGAPVLSSAIFEVTLPVLGHIKLVTALFFDAGVYLIVVGVTLDILRSLGAHLDSRAEVKLQ